MPMWNRLDASRMPFYPASGWSRHASCTARSRRRPAADQEHRAGQMGVDVEEELIQKLHN